MLLFLVIIVGRCLLLVAVGVNDCYCALLLLFVVGLVVVVVRRRCCLLVVSFVVR